MVIDKRKAQQLLGETMRDIGILVFVFAPLDAFFQRERPGWFPLALVVACGLLFIGLGIMLEAKE